MQSQVAAEPPEPLVLQALGVLFCFLRFDYNILPT